jgi:hypothetical protein
MPVLRSRSIATGITLQSLIVDRGPAVLLGNRQRLFSGEPSRGARDAAG